MPAMLQLMWTQVCGPLPGELAQKLHVQLRLQVLIPLHSRSTTDRENEADHVVEIIM